MVSAGGLSWCCTGHFSGGHSHISRESRLPTGSSAEAAVQGFGLSVVPPFGWVRLLTAWIRVGGESQTSHLLAAVPQGTRT